MEKYQRVFSEGELKLQRPDGVIVEQEGYTAIRFGKDSNAVVVIHPTKGVIGVLQQKSAPEKTPSGERYSFATESYRVRANDPFSLVIGDGQSFENVVVKVPGQTQEKSFKMGFELGTEFKEESGALVFKTSIKSNEAPVETHYATKITFRRKPDESTSKVGSTIQNLDDLVNGKIAGGGEVVLNRSEVINYFKDHVIEADTATKETIGETSWQFIEEMAQQKGVRIVPILP
jgi:hypothetical protein